MRSAGAKTVLQEASCSAAWSSVSTCLSSNREEAQWKGVRLLHLKLQQGLSSATEFAEQPECRAKIDVLVQLLASPTADPMTLFPLDVSASLSMHIGRPPRLLIQQVMQAQMTGLLLGVLIQLALADSHCLAQHIYKVEGLQLLHDIAMARTQHAHPELQDASEVKQLRPDVHEKLFQLYRLLPLAINSIYEVTFSRETYSAQISANAVHADNYSHRQLAQQLKGSLLKLQGSVYLDAASASTSAEDRQAQSSHTLRNIVSTVRSEEPQAGYVGELQHAWQSAVSGYNERQAGNCLFWLFEEPHVDSGRRTPSRSSSFAGSVASANVQDHGQQFGDDDAAPPRQHVDGVQQRYPAEHGEHVNSRTCRDTIPASAEGGAMRASTLDRISSIPVVRSAEAQPGQNAGGSSGGGWSGGHVVLFAVTAFAFGVMVGCYPQRNFGTDGLARVSEMYLNIAGNLMTEVLDERKQKRRTDNTRR